MIIVRIEIMIIITTIIMMITYYLVCCRPSLELVQLGCGSAEHLMSTCTWWWWWWKNDDDDGDKAGDDDDDKAGDVVDDLHDADSDDDYVSLYLSPGSRGLLKGVSLWQDGDEVLFRNRPELR